jgi:hypothetical protein
MNALSIGLLSQSCGHWFRIEHIRPFSHGTVLPAIMIAPSSLIKVRTTVLRLIESRAITQDNFYFTAEDYRLRIKPPLLDRYAGLLREGFNSGVLYGSDRIQWDTLIARKCQVFDWESQGASLAMVTRRDHHASEFASAWSEYSTQPFEGLEYSTFYSSPPNHCQEMRFTL